MKTLVKIAGLAVLASGSVAAFAGESLEGRWDAQLVRGDTVVPFRLDISGSGTSLKGTLYDGFRPYEKTTSASFKDGKLVLNLEHYLTTITAKLENGQLNGEVVAQNRENRSDYTFIATKHVDCARRPRRQRRRSRATGRFRSMRRPRRARRLSVSSSSSGARKLPRRSCASTVTPARIAARSRTASGC